MKAVLPEAEPLTERPARPKRAATSLKTEAARKLRGPRKITTRKPKSAIPAILLEGDYPAPTVLEGPGERFALNAKPAAAALPRVEARLPEGYGTQRLFLTARDPEWLYAHWDLSREQQRQCNTRSSDGHLVLRVYEERPAGQPLAEVHVHPESRYWFIHVGRGGAQFAAELGYYQTGETWTHVATSEPARTPVGTSSKDNSIEFATIPPDMPLPRLQALTRKAGLGERPLARAIEALRIRGHREFPLIPAPSSIALTSEQECALAQLTGAFTPSRAQADSMQISELVQGEQPPQFDWPASPTELPSSPSSPFGGVQEGGKGFFFNVNAELIVYGATEPSASVTIGGRTVELQPDGSFNCRFALPDGYYELSVVAVSADQVDTRAAELSFSRMSAYRGDVGAQPLDPALPPPSPENI